MCASYPPATTQLPARHNIIHQHSRTNKHVYVQTALLFDIPSMSLFHEQKGPSLMSPLGACLTDLSICSSQHWKPCRFQATLDTSRYANGGRCSKKRKEGRVQKVKYTYKRSVPSNHIRPIRWVATIQTAHFTLGFDIRLLFLSDDGQHRSACGPNG